MPIKEPTIKEVRELLIRYKIRGRSELDSLNKFEFLALVVEQMILKGKIRPYFNETIPKRDSVKVPSSVTKDLMMMLPDFKKGVVDKGKHFKHYAYTTPKESDVIEMALEAEGTTYNLYKHFIFAFVNLYHHHIPSNTFKNFYDSFKEHIRNGTVRSQEYRADEMYVIHKIEKSMLKVGFKKNKPLYLFASRLSKREWEITLTGGFHRLQAFRNLVYNGRIHGNTKIPCLIAAEWIY